MKLCMKSAHSIRSQKSLRPTHWSLFLGILQTKWVSIVLMNGSQKYYCYILLKSLLKTEQILLKELGLKMEW